MTPYEKLAAAFDAMNAANIENYISIDAAADLDSLEGRTIAEIEAKLAMGMPGTPESILEENDLSTKKQILFDALSNEARSVISIIIDCPKEMKEVCLFGKLDNVRVDRLYSLMRKQWDERESVAKIVKEVFHFATKIRQLNRGDI